MVVEHEVKHWQEYEVLCMEEEERVSRLAEVASALSEEVDRASVAKRRKLGLIPPGPPAGQ